MHTPPPHEALEPHARPHAPQLLRSADVSMHVPPQKPCPLGHCAPVHWPAAHVWFGVQALPHVPQLFGSLPVSTYIGVASKTG
ncbi:MAG: hypothetical protein A3G27_14485 [Betaproteobacteria bacterium RIFCSPLOWO2_12_FULL_66_14]|nr:MAG: hypothetical protein A3G27_14485 [Betaproteobacteria bacterium RIFCSPLOWO2_12_FULL_66_14]